eukprot:371761-Pyramimonas_sp.AAC.1
MLGRSSPVQNKEPPTEGKKQTYWAGGGRCGQRQATEKGSRRRPETAQSKRPPLHWGRLLRSAILTM